MRGIWDLWARGKIAKLVESRRPPIVQTWMGRATRLTHLPARSQSVHVARLGGYYNPKGYRHAHAWVGNTRGICDHLIREGLPANRFFTSVTFMSLRSLRRQFPTTLCVSRSVSQPMTSSCSLPVGCMSTRVFPTISRPLIKSLKRSTGDVWFF